MGTSDTGAAMQWIGWDIGGANLKAADGRGFALVRPFPLWQHPHQLAHALAELLAAGPSADALAVTMTGELADCFATKEEGVRTIIRTVQQVAGPRPVRIYLTDGRLVRAAEAVATPLAAAASNWHALARWAARLLPGPTGVLLDVGSTTTDVIPIMAREPAARGHTDPERLAWGELIYTGVQRSPVCGLVGRLPWGERTCGTAQELFATTWDVYLLLGEMAEEPEATETADGRPATRPWAHDRMARMICADRHLVDRGQATAMARAVAEAQLELLARTARPVLNRLPPGDRTAVISGTGEFLARRLLDRLGFCGPVVSLVEKLGPQASRAATAHALAVLAAEGPPP